MNQKPPPLGLSVIPEAMLKPDIEILERYQGFSAELLRISLLGIPVVGFFVTNMVLHHDGKIFLNVFSDSRVGIAATIALIGFGAASAFALFHRYISSDSLTEHIISLRHTIRGADGDVASAKEAVKRRKFKFLLSGTALIAASICLFVGVLALACSFAFAISHLTTHCRSTSAANAQVGLDLREHQR